MLARMSLKEWHEWLAFDSLEPIGRERADVPIAVLTWLVASIGGSKKIAGDVDDWLPKWKQPQPKPKTGDEMAEQMRERLRALITPCQDGQ